MARIEGIRDNQAGAFARTIFSSVHRRLGRVPEPMRVTAHQPKLLAALCGMELGQESLHSVDPVVKSLAEIKTAMMTGCPF